MQLQAISKQADNTAVIPCSDKQKKSFPENISLNYKTIQTYIPTLTTIPEIMPPAPVFTLHKV